MSADSLGAHDFSLQPSRTFTSLLMAVYSVALLVIFMLPLGALAKSALAVLLISSLVYYGCRDAWLLLPTSHVAIRLDGDGVVLKSRDGREISARVSRDSVVTPLLTILNVSSQDRQNIHAVIIFPDSMDKERFRELRVLMKWSGDVVSQANKPHSRM